LAKRSIDSPGPNVGVTYSTAAILLHLRERRSKICQAAHLDSKLNGLLWLIRALTVRRCWRDLSWRIKILKCRFIAEHLQCSPQIIFLQRSRIQRSPLH
jgi:hypothetical protein